LRFGVFCGFLDGLNPDSPSISPREWRYLPKMN
jgi:hypothetical protein